MRRRIAFLVNPAAGGGLGLSRWDALQSRLRTRGIEGRTLLPCSTEALVEAAASAAPGHDVLVAVGGDGTVLAVASGLVQSGATETSLAILPLGSGNDAARMAGILSLDDAVDALASERAHAFDAIQTTCRLGDATIRRSALVVAGAGFAADLLGAAPPWLKRVAGGRTAYVLGFFLTLARYRTLNMSASVGEKVHPGPLAAVVVANHTHAGGHSMHVGPGARPDDGLLEYSIVQGVSRFAVARQFLRLVRGTHIRHPAVAFGRATRVEVTAAQPVSIQADGEILGHSPATFALVPAAVRILVPG